MENVDDLEAKLRDQGYRVTRQRRAVWQALQGAGHVTVDELLERLDADGADVDPASVYRTLSLFDELGIARMSRLRDGDPARWELAHPDEHFHLVCDRCGEVDHHVGTLVQGIRTHLSDGHGFEVHAVELVVSGRCHRCRSPHRPAVDGS